MDARPANAPASSRSRTPRRSAGRWWLSSRSSSLRQRKSVDVCCAHAMVRKVLGKIGALVGTFDACGERAVVVVPVDDALEVVAVARVDEHGLRAIPALQRELDRR